MNESPVDRPLLVFDGECPFCRAWVEYCKCLTGDRVLYAPYQEVGPHIPIFPLENFASAFNLIMPDGKLLVGAPAVLGGWDSVQSKRWMVWSYKNIPAVASFSEAA